MVTLGKYHQKFYIIKGLDNKHIYNREMEECTGKEPPGSPGIRERRAESTRAMWSTSAAGCSPSTSGRAE